MHVTLLDDSIAFDGRTAATRPLGGAEKGFAALAAALARRGHEVHARAAIPAGLSIDGVRWEPIGAKPPAATDLLIAFRMPDLLESIRHAGRRVMWLTAAGPALARAASSPRLRGHKPLLLLIAEAQAAGLDRHGLAAALLPAAVGESFLTAPHHPAPADGSPPVAIVTAHPAHGLDRVVDLWCRRIHPAAPGAELHLCSAILARAAAGAAVADDLRPAVEMILAARGQGVRIIPPAADAAMAARYAAAALHLYPGHADDMGCHTLMESQACGCPAVVRPLGAATERVVNGVTAHVAPDDDALANLTVLLLTTPTVRAAMGAEAAALYRGRDWDSAAAALEGWVA